MIDIQFNIGKLILNINYLLCCFQGCCFLSIFFH